ASRRPIAAGVQRAKLDSAATNAGAKKRSNRQRRIMRAILSRARRGGSSQRNEDGATEWLTARPALSWLAFSLGDSAPRPQSWRALRHGIGRRVYDVRPKYPRIGVVCEGRHDTRAGV